jgi:hypothetical protein
MMFQLMAHAGMVAAAAAAIAAAPETKPLPAHPVIELRQYKLVTGKQDDFVRLFDSKFVESQEADGMRLIGHFTDHDRRDRFTWVREFPNMAAREKSLHAFYFGPVWLANRDAANPMLDDNDNVLFHRAARPDSGFGPSAPRPSVGAKGPHGMVFVTIEYLWKNPNEGFSNFFLDEAAPAMRKAGLPVLGAYVSEEKPNNFPRLPVRSSAEKVFVWFTQAHDIAEFDRLTARLHSSPQWKKDIAPKLADSEERPPQVLRLDPTPRSALR